ncbi:MAG TPA: hypothetical protein VJZ50_00955 [Candidatus Limnocylindrales bacterium]|nr:hypothetical protein [Candidatus Limnocylindrales bacterium]
MSEMPRQRLTPSPSADHAGHDALLVAQLAGGDPLDASQQQAAERLVATCSHCAALAADLRAISRVVAWEPLPPRRRDFRLDASQAERLRGSRVTRFLRRFSLPEPRGLRQAAVGAMSIGLLFVVAGNVWPEAGPVVSPADSSEAALPSAPVVAPLADSLVPLPSAPVVAPLADSVAPLPSAPVVAPLADSLAPAEAAPADVPDIGQTNAAAEAEAPPATLDELTDGTQAAEPEAAAAQPEAEAAPPEAAAAQPEAEAADRAVLAEEPDAAVAESEAAIAEPEAAAAPATGDEPASAKDEVSGSGPDEGMTPQVAAQEAREESRATRDDTATSGQAAYDDTDALAAIGLDQTLKSGEGSSLEADDEQAVPTSVGRTLPSDEALSLMAEERPFTSAEPSASHAADLELYAAAEQGLSEDADPGIFRAADQRLSEDAGQGASTQADLGASLVSDQGVDIESVLVAVGSVLAVGGALLLLLAWFIRRSADPLLR